MIGSFNQTALGSMQQLPLLSELAERLNSDEIT